MVLWFLLCTTQRAFQRGNKVGVVKEMQGLGGQDISQMERTIMFWVSIKLQWRRFSHIISSMKSQVLSSGHWKHKRKYVSSHLHFSCACHLFGFPRRDTKSSTSSWQDKWSTKEYFAPILCMDYYFSCTGLSYGFSPNRTLWEKPMWRIHVDPSLTRILGQGAKFTLILLGKSLIQSFWQFWLVHGVHSLFS